VAVLAVGCGLAWAAPASAQEGVRLSGTAGWAGRCHSGRPILVRARIVAERLVSGILSAEADGPPTPAHEVPVEVSGGNTEEVTLVVASPFGCSGVVLRLKEGGTTTTARVGVSDASDTVLLGLLPGVRPPGAIPASAQARTGVAAVAALEPELLAQTGAVAGLDSIAATAGDLDALSPEQVRGLVAWVADGGTLLVDAEGPEELGPLPDAWHPAAGQRIAAGRGQVRLTGTTLREGSLDGLAEPAAGSGADGSGFGFDMGGGDLARTLRERSGLRVLSLPVILAALVLYVLLVGPGVRIGLRRLGRLQLTWLVVPVAALSFTALAVAGGDVLRRGGKPTHLSVVETGVAARGRTFVGVPTRTKKAVAADLLPGWMPEGQGFDEQFGRSTVRATPRGQRLTTPAVPGGFVVTGAEGPVAVEGRLAVEVEPGSKDGIVRNEMPVALDHVAVFGPGGVASVGRIEAGASAPFTAAAGSSSTDLHSLAHEVWSARGDDVAPADVFSLLVDASSGDTDHSFMAAGWTDRLPSPVAVGGSRPAGTTLVIGRGGAAKPTGRFLGVSNTGMMMTRFLVGPGERFRMAWTAAAFGPRGFPGPFGAFGPNEDVGGMGAEVLVNGTWGPVRGLLPPAASTDGVVYLRTHLRGGLQPMLEPA
jgi:hypothetical protein